MSWHPKSAEYLKTLVSHTDDVLAMTTLNDGSGSQKLVTSSKDRTVRIWDIETGDVMNTIPMYNQKIFSLVQLPGKNGLLAISSGNMIKFYNPVNSQFEKALQGHSKTIYTMCSLPNGNIVSAGEDRYIKLWNVKTGNMIRSFIGHEDFVRCLKLNSQNKLVSASDDKTVRVWDLKTGEEID